MIVVGDFCLCCHRDHLFIKNSELFKEFISYLQHELQKATNFSQIICLTNHAAIQSKLSSLGTVVQHESESNTLQSWQSRLCALLETLSFDRSYNGSILFLSPFRGVVNYDRIDGLLKHDPLRYVDSYAIADRLDSNQNPVRFNSLNPKARKGMFATMQAYFQPLNFSAMVKKEYKNKVSGYTDSQFVPELYCVNESLIYTTLNALIQKNAKLKPVFLPVKDKPHLPLLYRLPVFHFHKETNLEI